MKYCDGVFYREQGPILEEAHARIIGGHYGGWDIARKLLRAGIWWPTLHNDAAEYARSCDVCQRVGKPSRHDEMQLVP